METLACVLAALAGAVHAAIFVMESLLWSRPAVWRRFGVRDAATAEANRLLMFNQGFYNLFLGVAAVTGAVLVLVGRPGPGWPVLVLACACMVGAAVVLWTRGRRYRRAALVQGAVPSLALLAALVTSL